MTDNRDSAGGRRSGFWTGVLVGAAVVVLLIVLWMVGMMAFGRCPMCGRPGRMMGGMMEGGRMDGEMPRWMMTEGGMGPEMMRDMRVIHTLLQNHGRIERQVEDILGGVRTLTTSDDTEVAGAIRAHVRQMKERLEKGQPIRMMDPLFREIFEHAGQIRMAVEDVEGGVRVTETSEDPNVQLLIRQHARRAVSEFVEGGMARAMRGTPLPEGYRAGRRLPCRGGRAK